MGSLREILPDVFTVPSNGRKGFGFNLFVRRPAGNLMLDASRVGLLTDAYGVLEAAGGVKAVIASDRHMADRKTDGLRERFGAVVYASAIEAAALANRAVVDVALPFEPTVIEGDVALIPTPGHTPGQFTCLIEVGGARLLFTSDFVYRAGGRWAPGNPSRRKMRASFDRLRPLRFDYVVPWRSYDEPEDFVRVEGPIDAMVDEMIAACDRP